MIRILGTRNAAQARADDPVGIFPCAADQRAQLEVLNRARACLGLFAAADALGLGFVRGVAPHVYVDRIRLSDLAAWTHLSWFDVVSAYVRRHLAARIRAVQRSSPPGACG